MNKVFVAKHYNMQLITIIIIPANLNHVKLQRMKHPQHQLPVEFFLDQKTKRQTVGRFIGNDKTFPSIYNKITRLLYYDYIELI